MGKRYICARCGECCRWPGYVYLGAGETERIAAHLSMSEEDFIDRFTRLAGNRSGLSLTEKENGECVFLEGDLCSIYPVRPLQCRGFPELWRVNGFASVCRAVVEETEDK